MKKITNTKEHQLGISIVELLVSMGIFLIIVVSGLTTIIHSFNVNKLSGDEAEATLLAQQGLEAVLSVRNQSWTNLSASSFQINDTGSGWTIIPGSETIKYFERSITIEEVQRDGSGNIVTSGGTVDPDTVKVTSEITWDMSPTRNNALSLTTYLTNWSKTISTVGNWTNPAVDGTLDLSGNNDGWHVVTDGTTAYVSRSGGNPEVLAIDLSTPSSPTIVGSTTIQGNGRAFSFNSDFMYVASTGQELSTVDFSTPSSPSVSNQYNAPGNTDGVGSGVHAGTLYFIRENSGSDELTSMTISTPSAPSVLDGIDLNGNPTEIAFLGNYAYISSDDNSEEIQIVDISNPNSLSLSATYNASGNSDAQTIYVFGSTLLLGRNSNDMEIYDISNPTSPSLLATYSTAADVLDITTSSDNSLAFLAIDSNGGEFEVVDISTLASPSQVSLLDVSGNNTIRELSYIQSLDAIVAVSQDNSQEVIVITN